MTTAVYNKFFRFVVLDRRAFCQYFFVFESGFGRYQYNEVVINFGTAGQHVTMLDFVFGKERNRIFIGHGFTADDL